MEAIDQTALAVELRKNGEEQLEREAGMLLQNGDYVIEQIAKTKSLRRWLDDHDIRAFIKDRLDRSFSGCRIETVDGGRDVCRITLTADAHSAFIGYLTRHQLQGQTRLMTGDQRQRYRFTSSVARRYDGRIECVSQIHPLFRFAVSLDSKDDDARQPQPVAASVYRSDVRERTDLAQGLYVLAIQCWEIRAGDDAALDDRRLAYAGALVASSTSLDAEVAEILLQTTINHGRVLTNFANDERLADASTTLRDVVLPALDRRFGVYVGRMEAEILDRVAIQRRALTRHRDMKAGNLEQRLAAFELERALADAKRARQLVSIANATRGQLRKLNDNVNARLSLLDSRRQFMQSFYDVACMVVEVRS